MLVSSCIFLHAETTEKELKKGGNLVQALFLASINLDAKHEKIVRNKQLFYVQNFQATVNRCAGIPRFMLLMWGQIKKRGKGKLRKLRLLSSSKGEENRIIEL